MGLGIIIANTVDLFTVFLAVTFFIILNWSTKFVFKRTSCHRSILALVFLIGVIISQHAQSYEFNDLYPVDDKFVTITGYVYDIPHESDNERFIYFIKTDSVTYKDKVIKTNETVRLSTDKRLSFSQNVRIKGFLKRINTKMNYSDFDYAMYYKGKNVFYTISDYEVTGYDSQRNSIDPVFLSRKAKVYLGNVIDVIATGDDAAIMKAVITGNKKTFSKDYKELLQKTGTMRMLYVAFLHVLIITTLVSLLTSVFSKKVRDYTLIIALLVYAFFNCELPVPLKCAMLTIASVFVLKNYGILHYPDVLSSVVIIILLFNPLVLFESGFVMSLSAGWLLFLTRDPLNKLFGFIRNIKIRRYVILFIVFNFGLFPLVGYFYDGISLYSILFSIIIFPFVTLMIISFPILLVELLVFGKAFLVKYVVLTSVYIIKRIPYIIRLLPFHYIDIPRPDILTIFIFYLGIIIARRIYYRGIKEPKTQLMCVVFTGALISVILTFIMNIGSCQITFVNVGQGDGAIIELPKGENIIVDGGGGEDFSDYDAGEKIFLPYLKNEGIYRIDLAVLSHFHRDHCLGTIAAMKDLKVKAVAIPDVPFENEYTKIIKDLAHDRGITIIPLDKGDIIKFESGAEIEVLSPYNSTSYQEENDTSLVFVLKVNGRKILFTGDATYNIENEIYSKAPDVDILKVAHHGSISSSSWVFLKKVLPEYSVISVGRDNTYMHPDDTVIKRLEYINSYILRTDQNGDIRFKIDKNKNISVDSYYE